MNDENKKKDSTDPTIHPIKDLDSLLEILDADELRHVAGGRRVRHVTVVRN